MADGVDLVLLRQLVGKVVAGLTGYTHRDLGEAFERLGLPEAPEGSKRERVNHSFAALPDTDLPMVAERILTGQLLSVDAAARNAIQDVLWASQGAREIPKRTRREIAQDLELAELVHNADRFRALLDRFWVLESNPFALFTGSATGLGAGIEQHVFRNPGDWSAEDLFEQLGAFDAGDTRFARFLEGLVSADVIPDEPAQRRVVATVNPHLRSAGLELSETGTDGGYPVFSVVSTQSARAAAEESYLCLAGEARHPVPRCHRQRHRDPRKRWRRPGLRPSYRRRRHPMAHPAGMVEGHAAAPQRGRG